MKKDWNYWKIYLYEEWIKPIALALVLALFIRTFFVQAFKIPTESMVPTLKVHDKILVNKLVYDLHEPERGDVIVFRYPRERGKDFIKRLIAFGGETVRIKGGNVYVNGEIVEEPNVIRANYYYNRESWKYGSEFAKIRVPENTFFVLGDNSAKSSDSREWGFVARDDVIGKAFFIWWPLKRIGKIE